MHVLMISDVYFPRVNGVSTSIQTYRTDLEQLGCRTSLVAPCYGAQWNDDQRTHRVTSVRVPLDPEDRFMGPRAIRSVLREVGQKADLVHIQTPFLAHWAGVNIARRLRLPTIETYHTFFEEYLYHYIPLLPKSMLQCLARRLSNTQCNAVDAVISPSHAMAASLKAYGVHRPIHVLPTGLETSDFQNGDGRRFRERHGIEADRPLLLHVGRVALEKNIDFIFDVLARVRDVVPEVLLVIAGEGPALGHFRRRVSDENLSRHVLFVGYLDRKGELVDCYQSANVFVFASATETQGLVLLEAMAAGLPVVSTAVFGTRDILDDAVGARVVEEDVERFAEAVVEVLTTPDLQRGLSSQAKSHAARWSNGALAKRMLTLYEGLVGQTSADSAPQLREACSFGNRSATERKA